MDSTAERSTRIPRANLRVPPEEFLEVWRAARDRAGGPTSRQTDGWYAAGVLATCQWLATADYTAPDGRRRPAAAPVSGKRTRAYEELIEAEFLAAELLPERQPLLLTSRPGWCEGIQATLRWAWRNSGPRPL
ncbi:hypothetical protein H7X46_11540 [Pseudonocardia sp. C8]|uniref:hypothetical protein n=1 Tax=Pseudonocardia sp. C8 TaxID=2762759 RepID=UPI001642FFFD|nr:hypothetical protein [Pseudonocardia sp. C8]MBC3191694.1 hypothetical protein [Pseudonocardia sp. C8]